VTICQYAVDANSNLYEMPYGCFYIGKFRPNWKSTIGTGTSARDINWPWLRYDHILLMYAECLNELTRSHTVKSWQGQDITVSRDIDEMKKGIQPVRIRAGLHDYTAEEYGDANLLRAKIKRERMIEFMGEGKRYFDLRRWMDAPVEENKRVYGLNVFQTSAKRDEFMQVIPVYNLSANFNDKMYFWPISHTDLKRNKNLVQNPGWTYND